MLNYSGLLSNMPVNGGLNTSEKRLCLISGRPLNIPGGCSNYGAFGGHNDFLTPGQSRTTRFATGSCQQNTGWRCRRAHGEVRPDH